MEIIDITGTWEVKITASGGTHVQVGSIWTAFIAAVQTGSIVSGTFVTVDGLLGKVTGNVTGDEVSMTIDQGPIRPETFHGVARVDKILKQMKGTYISADNGKRLQASFIAYKKNSSLIKLKLWWWRSLFPIITKIVLFCLSIATIVAVPASVAAAIKFYKQGSLVLCGISTASIVGSLISVIMWFGWSWSMGSMQILYEDLPSDDLPVWGMILTWEVLIFTSLNIISVCLYLYASGIRFTW